MTDFFNKRALLKYGVVKPKGKETRVLFWKNRLGKKGRSTLRNVLGQGVFRLVRKMKRLGPIYHRKKKEGMVGTNALAAVERKFLQVFYVLGIKKQIFVIKGFISVKVSSKRLRKK